MASTATDEKSLDGVLSLVFRLVKIGYLLTSPAGQATTIGTTGRYTPRRLG